MKLLFDFILVSGIILISIILTLLLKGGLKNISTVVLALIFGFMLAVNINTYADLHDIDWLYFGTFIFDDMAVWVLGPLLLIYIKSLYNKENQKPMVYWFYFIPALVYLVVLSLPILLSLIIGDYVFQYINKVEQFSHVYVLVRNGYMLLFMGLCLKIFYELRSAMKAQLSNFTQQNIGWIKSLLVGCLILVGIDTLTEVYEVIWHDSSINTGYITVLLMVMFVFYLGYYGTLQTSMLLPPPLNSKHSHSSSNKSQQILSADEARRLQTKLIHVLDEQKSYLDESLTLNVLANAVSTTDKKLSTFINQHLNKSFYNLINECRIKHVCKTFSDPSYGNQGIMEIAFQCGFNSKTTFNRLFKNQMGTSPSEYRKQQLNKL